MKTNTSASYDLVVLGSGPGGYVAAIRGAQLGLKTAIVERENLGGICLNWGCIPTKALLRSAEVFHYLRHAGDYGLTAGDVTADLNAVVKRSRVIATQLNQGVTHLMKKNKITVHMGEGTLIAANRLAVTKDGSTRELGAKNIIVATGARARELPFASADGKRIWTYRHAMVPTVIPPNLLIIGSGAIGVEFASFYNDMGAKVTIIEMSERLMPLEDAEVSVFLRKALTKQGIKIITGAAVESLEADEHRVTAKFRGPDGGLAMNEFSHCIVAIGIVPNTENIGLEALGVSTLKGHIVTDRMCRTNIAELYAIGDVTAPPWLAHKASHEGVIAVEAITGGRPHLMNPTDIPACTYCRPQVASVGLTEEEAKQAGHDIKVGSFPLIGNGKAIALGESEGFVKAIFDTRTGELLGAHMVGAEVTEMIQGFVVGKTLETTEEELMAAVFPHPTISEAMHESVLAAYGRAIHV